MGDRKMFRNIRLLFPLTVLFPCIVTCLADDLFVSPTDYWTVELSCPVENVDVDPVTARTTIVQPQGFSQVLTSAIEIRQGRAYWKIVYPLVDEGRFDVRPGNWDGYWVMGEYEFRAELLDREKVIHQVRTTLDPLSDCPRDHYGPIFSKSPHQFIICSPDRPAYIDEDQMRFTIGTMPDRVGTTTATVDVTSPRSDQLLAGPWEFALTGKLQQQTFDSSGWPRGEYWIRVRVKHENRPVGPYLIRKVWKETLPNISRSQVKRTGTRSQLVCGPAGWNDMEGIKFHVAPLRKIPSRPLVNMDRPWETELLYYRSIHYDKEASQFVLEYSLANGDYDRTEERAALPSTVCRAVSQDGITWSKPSLGLVEYRGTQDNNLVPEHQAYVAPRLTTQLSHDLEQARFRRHDTSRDGPPNLNHVFVTAVKRSFVGKCSHPSGKPYRIGSWPMEKRGNDYLVLTDEPVLYLGVGMDLYHSTEKIALHLEDKATGRLYYFFRPGAPAYPPHDTPYDNMHMTRRVLGVMWTEDGIHWQRQLVMVPDEKDATGSQFYYISSIASRQQTAFARPAMALEQHWNKGAVRSDEPIVGTLSFYDARANKIWAELVYANDLLHWHRFEDRKKWLANGRPGSADFGLVKIASHRLEFTDEWWFPYTAVNQRHQDYIGLAKMESLKELQTRYPQYVEVPGFMSWEQYWQRTKSTRYTIGIGRCQAGRVSYAQPISSQSGQLTTDPILLEHPTLLVNATIGQGGELRIALLNEAGETISGFTEEDAVPIGGDSLAAPVRWHEQSLSKLLGTPVRLRFTIRNAKLYSYRFANEG